MINLIETTQTLSQVAAPTAGSAILMDAVESFSAQVNVTVAAPTAKTFTVDDATDIITTASAHGLVTGNVLRVSNSGGALPTGLVGATDYFVILLSTTTFKLASSLANAQAGTAIDITTAGTGTQTETPTALAGGSVKLQKSNDGSNWSDEGSATNITQTATIWLEKVDPTAKYLRLYFSLTAGSIYATSYLLAKGSRQA